MKYQTTQNLTKVKEYKQETPQILIHSIQFFWSTIKKLLLFQPRILQFTLNLSPKDVGFYGFRLEEPFCFITQKRLERSSLATGISFKFFNAFILHKNVDNKKLIYQILSIQKHEGIYEVITCICQSQGTLENVHPNVIFLNLSNNFTTEELSIPYFLSQDA